MVDKDGVTYWLSALHRLAFEVVAHHICCGQGGDSYNIRCKARPIRTGSAKIKLIAGAKSLRKL